MQLATLDEFSLRSLILADGGMLRTDGLFSIIYCMVFIPLCI